MLTGGNTKGSIFKDREVGLVSERNAVDTYFSGDGKRSRSKNAIFCRVDDLRSFAGESLNFAGRSDTSHADVEELTDSIQRIQHDRGQQNKGDGLAHTETTIAETPVSKSCRAGDHSKRKDTVNNQQDHLVSRKVTHDLDAHVLCRISEGATNGFSCTNVGQR